MGDLGQLTEAIRIGDQDAAARCTRAAIDGGEALSRILDAMVAGMDDVGERFKRHEAFVPEMLIAARAMKAGMSLLEPLLVQAGITPKHTVVIGTVRGDLHDIGKNLVAMMWKGANFGVVDLGVNVAPQIFVDAVQQHGAKAVGLSTLLTTTMPAMKDIVTAIKANGDGVKVIIGGSPVTQAYADQIGADAYASDAATAVDVLRSVLHARAL